MYAHFGLSVLFISLDYISSFILPTPNVLEGPKWLSVTGIIGTIFFLGSLTVFLWEYALKDITNEEWTLASRVIFYSMMPWFALRLIWFPIIRLFTSYFVNQKLASTCRTLEWLNTGLFIIGSIALLAVAYQFLHRKFSNGCIENEGDETNNHRQPIIPKCPRLVC